MDSRDHAAGFGSRRTERALFRFGRRCGADLSAVMDIRRLQGTNRNSGNHRDIMALLARKEQDGHAVCFVFFYIFTRSV